MFSRTWTHPGHLSHKEDNLWKLMSSSDILCTLLVHFVSVRHSLVHSTYQLLFNLYNLQKYIFSNQEHVFESVRKHSRSLKSISWSKTGQSETSRCFCKAVSTCLLGLCGCSTEQLITALNVAHICIVRGLKCTDSCLWLRLFVFR